MEASRTCINHIKRSEGFRNKAYRCPAGVWTVGYGTTKIGGKPVDRSMLITEAFGEQLLQLDLTSFVTGVDQLLKRAPATNQAQFDALVSFAYNCGLQALKSSSLLKLHNVGNFRDACDEFGKWVNANKKPLLGLQRRRYREQMIYRGETDMDKIFKMAEMVFP